MAELVEVVHVQAAQKSLQRVVRVGQRDPHGLELVGIHVDGVTGHRRAEGADHRTEFRPAARRGGQGIGGARQRGDIAARAIFQHELESAGRAQPQNRRQAEGEREGLRNLREPALRRAQNRIELGLFRGALFPGLQRGDDRRDVGIRGAGGDIQSAQHEVLVHSGKLADHRFDLARGGIGAVRGGAIGQAHGDEERPLIFARQESRRQPLEQAAR